MERFGLEAGAVRNVVLGLAATAVGVLALAVPLANAYPADSVNVTTYHYDNYRTGWNQNETILTPSEVLNGDGPFKFQPIYAVPLDDQVDAQPLIMTNQSIAGGTHNVVYVATENNSIYAIDAD